MASILLGGNPIHTSGELPKVGTQLADFKLIQNDLSVASKRFRRKKTRD
jgi:thiol peroxidase